MSMLNGCRALAPAGVPFTPADVLAGLRAVLAGSAGRNAFREAVSRAFGVDHVFAFSSGRAAMSAGLRAFGALYPERDEVAVPAYTSFSVASAVVHAGYRVIPYDLDAESLSPDMADLEHSLSGKTLCIVVCHLFGYPADMDAVLDVAQRHGVPVFDDAAQAMGARYKGRLAGTFGDMGLFSMSRGKNISAVDGGILVTNRADLARALRGRRVPSATPADTLNALLKALALCVLLHPRMYWIPRSIPALRLGASIFDPAFPERGLTSFQAGLGVRMLNRLTALNDCRTRVADELLRRLPGCRVPRPVPGAEPVYLRLPLLNGRSCCEAPELGVVPAYPTTLDRIPELKPYLGRKAEYPGAERLADAMLTLPTHGFVSSRDVHAITSTLLAAGGCHG